MGRITTYIKSLFQHFGRYKFGRVGEEKVYVVRDFLSYIVHTNCVSDPDSLIQDPAF
jgi:hypothetical protein